MLGDVVSRLAGISTLPEEYLPSELSSSVDLNFVDDERNKQRDVWSGVGGHIKPSFTLQVSVGADTKVSLVGQPEQPRRAGACDDGDVVQRVFA